MKIVLFFLTGFLIFLFSLSLIPLQVHIKLQKEESNDEVAFHFITLFGLIQYELSIPFVDIITYNGKAPGMETKTSLINKKNKKKSREEKYFTTVEEIKKNYVQFKKYFSLLKPVMNSLLKKFKLTHFEWETHFGISDAAATGILSGILWMIKGQVISFLKNNITCKKVIVNIVPYFNKEIFKTHLDCIIRIKIGYIITASIKIAYLLLFKGGELNGQSSDRSLNEDDYGKSKGYGGC